jgi:hypothetical protein
MRAANLKYMRKTLRSLISGVITGAVFLGAAWASAGLLPAGKPSPSTLPTKANATGVSAAVLAAAADAEVGEQLPGGLFKVGAAKVSIAPKSVAEGGPWIRHGKDGNCDGQSTLYTPLSNPSCLRTFDSNWATGVDNVSHLGVYVRAMTVSNGKDTIAMAVMDTVGWFWGYPENICGDCGSKAIAESLQASIGIPADNIVISSTHTHASADTVMASPKWYFELVRDAVKQAITEAHTGARLATLQTGTTPAKAFNVDRRIVTRAVPDYELGWMRGVSTENPDQTIGTMVNFSVHPTITAGNEDLHSGLVGHMAKRIEETWGGTAMFMPAGLGDQTVNRSFGRDGFGYGLADLVIASEPTAGYTLKSNDIVSDRRVLQIPADNLSLVGANEGGVFVRDGNPAGPFAGGPATSVQQKGRAQTPSCVGASPISLYASIGGFRIGTPGKIKQRDPETGDWVVPPGDPGDAIVILQSPGEAFASISATTKDYLSRARNVMMIGLANDQIGYIIPAEQYDLRAANAAGLTAPSHEMTNYEESLSTGRCTGDQVQNAFIDIGTKLGVMGDGEGR